jgi:hypothetical protein
LDHLDKIAKVADSIYFMSMCYPKIYANIYLGTTN